MYGAGTELYEYYLEVVKPQQLEAQLETTECTFTKAEAAKYCVYTQQRWAKANAERKASSVGKKAQGLTKASHKTRTS